tara:strand:- start:531 stop:782 length:252 start_codon:yes stop_codon:yes gene_type:complete
MSDLAVVQIRLDSVESKVDKHEEILQRLTDQHNEMQVGIAEVATEVRMTNELLEQFMTSQQKIMMALIGLVGAVVVGANYVVG